MKICIQFAFFLLTSYVSSAPTSDTCCSEKKVGETTYMLMESDNEDMTNAYGCKDGCVYKSADGPGQFCFKEGGLPVTCLDEKEFHWCYEGDCGPAFWGEEYEACNGMSQSPIDIVSTGATFEAESAPALLFNNYDKVRVSQLGNTEEHYPGAPQEKGDRLENGTLKNNGHTAQLDVIATLPEDVGVLSGGPLDGDYQILQLHFHWGADDSKGSEHTLDGKQFPLEMHIVHKKMGVSVADALNMTGGLAVAGFFFEVADSDNAAIEPLIEVLTNIIDPKTFVDMSGSTFKISDLVAGVAPIADSDEPRYSNYAGSLTTPGCMEVVNWINFLDTIKISSEQLEKFRALKDGEKHDIVDNFRPVQPLNGRTVTFYGA